MVWCQPHRNTTRHSSIHEQDWTNLLVIIDPKITGNKPLSKKISYTIKI